MAKVVIKPIKLSKTQQAAMNAPMSLAEKRAIHAAEQRRVIVEADEPETMDTAYEEPIEVVAPQRTTRQATTRQPTRQGTRESMTRTATGRLVVVGRDGEQLTRKRQTGVDPFYIDPLIVPKGWSYQWNAITVLGNGDIMQDITLQMAENGWRPVPADRHPGRYMPAGHKGAIIRGGQRLEERPMALTLEAKAEDDLAARKLISDRNESLQLATMKNRMGSGFEMGQKYRGTGGDIRMSIDQALDAPRPAHKVAE